jgi:hypothetical protein
MSEMLQTLATRCPYCGAGIELLVDTSSGGQDYVEDCPVCCRPMECRLEVDGQDYRLEVRRDDE